MKSNYLAVVVTALLGGISSAAVAQTITHVPLYTFNGDSANDSFGVSVSGAGDVNGDGFDDVIVGAPFDDNNEETSGSARVFSGRTGDTLYTLNGDTAGARFGTSVSGVGDVNGDGTPDLIVGANEDDNLANRGGSARVFSGFNGSSLYEINGQCFLGGFGSSVSGAGDVNGDGTPDLIVGGPGECFAMGGENGRASVLSGRDGSVLSNFLGDGFLDFFGTSVSGVGDVNGDGTPDLIVGASGDDNNGDLSGSARVLSGSDGRVLYDFDGNSAGDRFGSSVSGAGDVNGDGTPDLIVGAPVFSDTAIGSVRVLSGSDGRVLYNFNGDNAGDRFGRSVSGAGDVNGDGRLDLIVGASSDDNNGFDSGSVRVFSGSDGRVLYTFTGDSAGDHFGTKVSGAGDVNGDGIDDFIVGASSGGANDGGYARVFVSQGALPPSTGDFSGDGNVDGADVDFYIGNLGRPASGALAQLDLNNDGTITLADHDQLVTTLVMTSNGVTGALLGDINLDGRVDVVGDAFILVANLLQSITSRSQGDLNADGQVTVVGDAFILVSDLGQSTDP